MNFSNTSTLNMDIMKAKHNFYLNKHWEVGTCHFRIINNFMKFAYNIGSR